MLTGQGARCRRKSSAPGLKDEHGMSIVATEYGRQGQSACAGDRAGRAERAGEGDRAFRAGPESRVNCKEQPC
jgi:hypothetical protein